MIGDEPDPCLTLLQQITASVNNESIEIRNWRIPSQTYDSPRMQFPLNILNTFGNAS